MKKQLIFLCAILASAALFAQQSLVIRLENPESKSFEFFQESSYEISAHRPGEFLDITSTFKEYINLKKQGYDFKIMFVDKLKDLRPGQHPSRPSRLNSSSHLNRAESGLTKPNLSHRISQGEKPGLPAMYNNSSSSRQTTDCGTVTDLDGNEYNTVVIGNQCWMKENMAYLPAVNQFSQGSYYDPHYYVYDYDGTSVPEAKATVNYQTYGVLYNWPAALTACPEGWHVPTDDEWTELTTYLNSNTQYLCDNTTNWIGKSIAAETIWMNSINTCAVGNEIATNNSSGFAALPSGQRVYYSIFSGLTWNTMFWSSSLQTPTVAWTRHLHNGQATINKQGHRNDYGLSLRCIKDSTAPSSYNLQLDVSPYGSGIVEGAGDYYADEDVYINATANQGWVFINWSDSDEIISLTPNFIYSMPAENMTLTANFTEQPVTYSCGSSTITDNEGNVYNVVLIGNQCWMQSNLKATHYNNNDPIPTGLSDNDWWQTTQGAYAVYDHTSVEGINSEAEMIDAYGILYNWYTVSDSRGICPPGWSVPSQDDWIQLTDYISGGEQYGGQQLRSCREVNSPLGEDCNTDVHPRWDELPDCCDDLYLEYEGWGNEAYIYTYFDNDYCEIEQLVVSVANGSITYIEIWSDECSEFIFFEPGEVTEYIIDLIDICSSTLTALSLGFGVQITDISEECIVGLDVHYSGDVICSESLVLDPVDCCENLDYYSWYDEDILEFEFFGGEMPHKLSRNSCGIESLVIDLTDATLSYIYYSSWSCWGEITFTPGEVSYYVFDPYDFCDGPLDGYYITIGIDVSEGNSEFYFGFEFSTGDICEILESWNGENIMNNKPKHNSRKHFAAHGLTGQTASSRSNLHTDEYGFSALPAGLREGWGTYWSLGHQSAFWTSSPSGQWAHSRFINYNEKHLFSWASGRKNGYSVRCFREADVVVVPEHTTVDNITVVSGQDTCFNATQSITVQNLVVESGGSVTLIAGNNIQVLPETQVHNNAYFRAYIAPTGPFCDQEKSMIASKDESPSDEISFPLMEKEIFFRIFPNPTTGLITLEMIDAEVSGSIAVQIFGMRGKIVYEAMLNGSHKYSFDLSGQPAGIYFVRVVMEDRVLGCKLVKQ